MRPGGWPQRFQPTGVEFGVLAPPEAVRRERRQLRGRLSVRGHSRQPLRLRFVVAVAEPVGRGFELPGAFAGPGVPVRPPASGYRRRLRESPAAWRSLAASAPPERPPPRLAASVRA